jgi:hypothetical protein
VAAWALALSACGSSGGSGAPSDDAASKGEATTNACQPGEAIADDGHCEPAGIPPTSCGAGFQSDGDRGCTAILPADPCPAGRMAVPGETDCHDVRPCADGTWGDIPVDATTQFVDGSFAGASKGTMAAPWKNVMDAVNAASSGAIVAIAAGTYPEDVVVSKKSVRLWGRCPSMVTIKGIGLQPAAVTLFPGADDSELHAVGARGPDAAISVSGATGVVIDHVWTYATANRSIDIEDSLGETSVAISDSLFEGAHKFGAFVSGATATFDRVVVRGVQSLADGTFGRGIEIENHGASRANVTLRGSIVEQCHEVGVVVFAADATIESSIVRDTQPRASDHTLGRGIDVLQDGGMRGTLAMRGSIVSGNAEANVVVAGGDATIESTMITDARPRASDATLGRGIAAQIFDDQRANLIVRACVVARNLQIGISVAGGDAQIESTLVRDTSPQSSDGRFGRGICVQPDLESGARSTATIHATVVRSSHDTGITVSGRTRRSTASR